MTFWIVVGAVGVALWLAALILVIALCVTADELPAEDRDEQAARATLYPTAHRDVHGTVIDLMHTGMDADDAVRRVMRGTRL